MLGIDDQPIESEAGDELGGFRTRKRKPGADRWLTGRQTAFDMIGAREVLPLRLVRTSLLLGIVRLNAI